MRDQLTKAQVEALFLAMDGPLDELLGALGAAVAHLHGSTDLDAVLRRLGRDAEADRLAAGDEETAWSLATELNERRHL